MTRRTLSPLLPGLMVVFGCSAEEAPRASVTVEAAAGPIAPVETDLGYRVTLTEARVALGDITFTIASEAHTASRTPELLDWLVPTAYAHPGHYQGSEVTGELRGQLIVDFLAERPTRCGLATMVVGTYTAANVSLTTSRATGGSGGVLPVLHTVAGPPVNALFSLGISL